MIDELKIELEKISHKPVLVEGPNDRKALEKLGFTKVKEMQGPLYKVVEDLQEEEELCILTDLDRHGRKLYRFFFTELTKRGVAIDNKARELLFRTEIRQIEGLWNYLQRVA